MCIDYEVCLDTVCECLTVVGQLDHQPVIKGLSSCVLRLHPSLVFITNHLRADTITHELLVVELQVLNNVTILFRTHLGQLKQTGNEMQNMMEMFVKHNAK